MSSEGPAAWAGPMPRVGDVAERTHVVGPDFIRLFTEISGDRNPLHYDEAAARASRFGEIVVQGGVTSAILNAVVAEALPGPGTVFLHVDWRFTAPVRPGDTITGRVEVLEVRADKPITTLATRVTRQDGVVALDGQGRVLHDAARQRRCGRRGGSMTRRRKRRTKSSTARLKASGCSQ